MHRDLLVNYEKVVKFLNFICGVKIKLQRKFSGICQVIAIITLKIDLLNYYTNYG